VITVLHLDNNVFSTVSVAKDVVDAASVLVVYGYLLLVKIAYISDVALSDFFKVILFLLISQRSS
jgi:hypothetical protein